MRTQEERPVSHGRQAPVAASLQAPDGTEVGLFRPILPLDPALARLRANCNRSVAHREQIRYLPTRSSANASLNGTAVWAPLPADCASPLTV